MQSPPPHKVEVVVLLAPPPHKVEEKQISQQNYLIFAEFREANFRFPPRNAVEEGVLQSPPPYEVETILILFTPWGGGACIADSSHNEIGEVVLPVPLAH